MTIQIGVLGPVRITINDVALTLSSRQMGRVATVLAGWPGEVVDSSRIIDALWGSRSIPVNRNTLQAHVSQLRKVIGADRLLSRDGGYVLNVAARDIDANAFEEAVQRGTRAVRAQRYASGLRFFERGLSLWRGDAFLDVDDSELLARREILDEMHAHAVEQYLECQLELAQDSGDMSVVIGRMRAAAAHRPEREHRWTMLIRAMAVGDRQSEMGLVFARAQEQLRDMCGLGPGPELLDTYEKALLHTADLIPDTWKLHHNLSRTAASSSIGEDPHVRAMVERLCQDIIEYPHQEIWVIGGDADRAELATAIGHGVRGDFRVGVHVHDAQAGDLSLPVDPSPELLVIAHGTPERVEACRSALDRGPFATPRFVGCSAAPPVAMDSTRVLYHPAATAVS